MVSRRSSGTSARRRLLKRLMNLVVYIDFKSPDARLALGPTRKLAEECGIAVDWRPYHLQPRRRSIEANSKGATHARVRTEYRRRERAFYARQQNIRFVQPTHDLDSFVANAGLLWARREDFAEAYVGDVFDRVWAGELDPASEIDVTAALGRVGGASEGFHDYLLNEAEDALDEVAAEALERGAVNVPAYFVADDIYVGREHLPMIRWLLEGQSCDAPV